MRNARISARLALVVIALAILLVGAEAMSQLAYRLHEGDWYWRVRARGARGLVQPHSYFGACHTPSISREYKGARITHNSFRCRGQEFTRQKPKGVIRIVCLGGSSTYGTGVSDDETWPYLLGQELGAPFEVINMGTPGGTSFETLAQSAFLFSEIQPDIAIYYMGWNDASVQHIAGLWPDVSDSHGKWLMGHAVAGWELREHTATGYFIKRMLYRSFFSNIDPDLGRRNIKGTSAALTDAVDEYALGLYERNLRNTVAICRTQNVQPLFVPQVLNYKILTSDKPYGWLPFVRDRDLEKMMGVYNASLSRIAQEGGVPFAAGVLAQPYEFVDNGHFSRAGNQLFARILAGEITRSRTAR